MILLERNRRRLMKTEYEVKFLSVDHEGIRSKLELAGGKLHQPMRLMRRAIFDTPEIRSQDSFIRVRDEGHKVTLTYKKFETLSFDGAKEIEVEVSNFENTIAILEKTGLNFSSLQESKRETWQLGDCEVVLDEWPWLDPYIEIEGPDQKAVQATAKKLGLNWDRAMFGDVMVAYRAQYPFLSSKIAVSDVQEVKFGDPLPDILKEK